MTNPTIISQSLRCVCTLIDEERYETGQIIAQSVMAIIGEVRSHREGRPATPIGSLVLG